MNARQLAAAIAIDTRRNVKARSAFAADFRAAFRKGVEGIIQAGQVLVDAKAALPHGEFTDMVERDLRLGIRKAQMLMAICEHPVISNAHHWCAFPPSWRTLWELTHIRPDRRMLELIAGGEIYQGMTREEAIGLMPGQRQETAKAILSVTIAELLKQSRHPVPDAVRELQSDPGSMTPDTIKRLGLWLTEVGEHWEATE
jgi:hypothetical protein